MNFVWFLSTPGELHEEHVPMGIFSSFNKLKQALENTEGKELMGYEQISERLVEFVTYIDEDKHVINQVYCAYKIPLDVLCPEILRT